MPDFPPKYMETDRQRMAEGKDSQGPASRGISQALQGIELRHLRYFVAVVKEGSITKAAQSLHTSQPSLGKQLRDLEDRLGIELFAKSNPTTELTDGGKEVYAKALKLLEGWSEWMRKEAEELDRFKTPLVRIFASEPIAASTAFAELLKNLRTDCPKVPFEVVDPDEERDLYVLLDGEVDFFCSAKLPEDDREIESHCIAEGPYVVMIPPEHPLAAEKELKKDHLKGLPHVALDPDRYHGMQAAIDDFWQGGDSPQEAPKPAYAVRHLATALELVARGDGYFLSPGLRYSQLFQEFAVLPVKDAPLAKLYLLWKNKVLSQSVENVANSVPHLPPINPSAQTARVNLAG